MEFVQIVNRSKANLSVMFDGRRHVLVPGLNTVPSELVAMAKRQNRVMGTEDPLNPLDFESLIGVPDVDDCSDQEQSRKVEALDRSLMVDPKRRAAKPVKATRGQSRSMVSGDDLPGDAGFAAERA